MNQLTRKLFLPAHFTFFVALLVGCTSNTDNAGQAVTPPPEPPPNRPQYTAPVAPSINFSEIIRDREAQAKLEDYKSSLSGRRGVDWTGNVLEGLESPEKGPYFSVDMEEEKDGKPDVLLYVKKEQSPQPQGGQKIRFSGVVKGLATDPNLTKDTVELQCTTLEVLPE